jgi:hypothetical protein
MDVFNISHKSSTLLQFDRVASNIRITNDCYSKHTSVLDSEAVDTGGSVVHCVCVSRRKCVIDGSTACTGECRLLYL